MTVAGKVVSSSIPAVPSTINIIEHTNNPQKAQEANPHAHHAQKQHLEAFASYCRIFYLSSLRRTADDASACSARSMDEARAVLQVFDDLCSGQQSSTGKDVNERYHDAICKCNLMSYSSSGSDGGAWMMEYIRIRDRERSAAHKIQMLERQSMLCNFLAETSTSTVSQPQSQQSRQQNALEETNKLPEMTMTSRETIRIVTRAIREFVASYQANIGAHPLIAGIKTLLERQIINEQYRLRWTVNGCTLTENCQSGGAAGDDNGDMRYMKDSVRMLRLFLDLVDYNEVASDDVEKDIVRDNSGSLAVDEVVMCFQMKDGISNDTLKHLLSILPDQRKLDARPTGSLATSNVPRINSDGEMDEPITFLSWCFDNCVIS